MSDQPTEDLIPLPPGWSIKPEPLVGVSAFDNSGSPYPVDQHPLDDNAFRRLLWYHWTMRLAWVIAQERRSNARVVSDVDERIMRAVFRWLHENGVIQFG